MRAIGGSVGHAFAVPAVQGLQKTGANLPDDMEHQGR
jgi:hypothetical protein